MENIRGRGFNLRPVIQIFYGYIQEIDFLTSFFGLISYLRLFKNLSYLPMLTHWPPSCIRNLRSFFQGMEGTMPFPILISQWILMTASPFVAIPTCSDMNYRLMLSRPVFIHVISLVFLFLEYDILIYFASYTSTFEQTLFRISSPIVLGGESNHLPGPQSNVFKILWLYEYKFMRHFPKGVTSAQIMFFVIRMVKDLPRLKEPSKMHLKRQGSRILDFMTSAIVSPLPQFNGVFLFMRFKEYLATKMEG